MSCTLHPHPKTSNIFPESSDGFMWANWSLLTSHARLLRGIAHDPGVRPRDIAASAGITERSANGICHRPGRGRLHGHAERRPQQPLPDPRTPAAAIPDRRERTVGEAPALLPGTHAGLGPRRQESGQGKDQVPASRWRRPAARHGRPGLRSGSDECRQAARAIPSRQRGSFERSAELAMPVRGALV